MKLSLIIPVYNEKNNIGQVIERILSLDMDKELLIVDDGSTDGTREILNGFKDDHIRMFYHDKNRGKGAAIRTAQPHITGDVVIIQDADLEYQPSEYPLLLKPIEDGFADVVYGSRFLGCHRVFLVYHYIGNKLLTAFANLLYNTMLSDMETGFKVFKSSIFKNINIRSDRFNFEVEITAKIFKQKLRVVETPITYYGRGYEEGKKITWRDTFPAIVALIKYRFVD